MQIDFDGFAIGGLAVGEEKSEREDVCELTAALLPGDRPRYLMGVGTPVDVLEAVHRGVDMFDCIIPSRWPSAARPSPRAASWSCAAPCTNSARTAWIPPAPVGVRHAHPRLPAPPDQDAGAAGLDARGPAQHPLLPPVHARGAAEHSGRSLSCRSTGERREILPVEDIDHPVTHPKRTSDLVQKVGAYELHGEPPAIRHSSSGRVIGTTPQLVAAAESQIIQLLRQPADAPPLVVWGHAARCRRHGAGGDPAV